MAAGFQTNVDKEYYMHIPKVKYICCYNDSRYFPCIKLNGLGTHIM